MKPKKRYTRKEIDDAIEKVTSRIRQNADQTDAEYPVRSKPFIEANKLLTDKLEELNAEKFIMKNEWRY